MEGPVQNLFPGTHFGASPTPSVIPTRPCMKHTRISFGVVKYLFIYSFCFTIFFFPDIFPRWSAANARIAAGRKTVGDVRAATSPMSGLPGPERLRKTEG